MMKARTSIRPTRARTSHTEVGMRNARLGVKAALVALALVATSATARAEEGFTDPFAYCRAVGTIDAPDARWRGPAVPKAVARGLQRALGVAPSEPLEPFERGTSWRCMDGAVYACNVGSNRPCSAKPSTDLQPNEGMRTWCKENPGSDFIPMYITGHDTLFDWSCDGESPKRGRQISQLDARGFVANIWHRLTPSE